MNTYAIKYVDEKGNVADADYQTYEAENELDALHQFTEVKREDLIIENIEIIKDDPKEYLLKIKGWFHNTDKGIFDTYEGIFEYYAERTVK